MMAFTLCLVSIGVAYWFGLFWALSLQIVTLSVMYGCERLKRPRPDSFEAMIPHLRHGTDIRKCDWEDGWRWSWKKSPDGEWTVYAMGPNGEVETPMITESRIDGKWEVVK